jgi:hypothetical protein
MNDLWSHIHDVTALIIVCGCFVYLFIHWQPEVASILALAAGWAFGRGYNTIAGK